MKYIGKPIGVGYREQADGTFHPDPNYVVIDVPSFEDTAASGFYSSILDTLRVWVLLVGIVVLAYWLLLLTSVQNGEPSISSLATEEARAIAAIFFLVTIPFGWVRCLHREMFINPDRWHLPGYIGCLAGTVLSATYLSFNLATICEPNGSSLTFIVHYLIVFCILKGIVLIHRILWNRKHEKIYPNDPTKIYIMCEECGRVEVLDLNDLSSGNDNSPS